MKHLTANEIIDFISMTNLDEKSLKNASVVTSHITECETCLRKVNAFQVIFDEFERLGLHAKSKYELYEFIESKMADMPENAKIDNDK